MKSISRFPSLLAALLLCFASSLLAAPVSFKILTTIDYPGVTNTSVTGINENGDVAGFYTDASNDTRGFIRRSNGQFSAPILDPKGQQGYTILTGINNSRTVCGIYLLRNDPQSFLLAGKTFTDITVDAEETIVNDLNDAGDFCGIAVIPDAAFVVLGGVPNLFQVPGSTYNIAEDVNNLDQVVGSYDVGTTQAGFRREADGTLIYPITVSGSTNVALFGINDHGQMVGTMIDTNGSHAVFFQPSGSATIFDYPGGTNTSFGGINNKGLICGGFTDADGTHAFIARLAR
jgi:uncharacterized membrane protein